MTDVLIIYKTTIMNQGGFYPQLLKIWPYSVKTYPVITQFGV